MQLSIFDAHSATFEEIRALLENSRHQQVNTGWSFA